MTDSKTASADVDAARGRLRRWSMNHGVAYTGDWQREWDLREAEVEAAIRAESEATVAALREAAQTILDAALDVYPEEWVDEESSMAMAVTLRGRDIAALRVALAATPEAER